MRALSHLRRLRKQRSPGFIVAVAAVAVCDYVS